MSRTDRFEEKFEEHPYRTGISTGIKVTLAVVLLVIIMVPIALGLGWFTGAASIVSFQHVREEYGFAYGYDRSMQATTRNVCIAEKRGLEPTALAAYEQTYSNIEGKYDARMADAFRAKHVKPGDLPLVAPTFEERKRALCR